MMGDIRMKVEGIPKLELAIMKTTLRYKRGFRTGLEKALNQVFEDSQAIVPVDTSALKSSGRVEITGTGFNSRGYIAYGGPVSGFSHLTSVHYAMIVHEATHVQFKNGEAKFVEKAIEKNRDAVPNIIRDEMRKGGLSW
jgi:hypothetical protein